jgi:hypothetical protein
VFVKGRRRRAALLSASWLIASTAVGAAACNAILGTSSFTACNALADAGWYDPDTLACIQANCCTQASACERNPVCAELGACLAGSVPVLRCQSGAFATLGTLSAPDAGAAFAALEQCAGKCQGPWACVSHTPLGGATPGAVKITLLPTIFQGNLGALASPIPWAAVESYTVYGDREGLTPIADGGPVDGRPIEIEIQEPYVPFTGYIDVKALPVLGEDGGPDTPLEALVYLNWGVTVDTTVDLRLLTHGSLNILANQLMATPRPGTAIVTALVRDCIGNAASNVILTPNTEDTNPFTCSDPFAFGPCQDLVGTGSIGCDAGRAPVTKTQDPGIAGWANLGPISSVEFGWGLEGWDASPFPVKVVIKPDAMTYVWLTPPK